MNIVILVVLNNFFWEQKISLTIDELICSMK